MPLGIMAKEFHGKWVFSAGNTHNAREAYTLEVIDNFSGTITLSSDPDIDTRIIVVNNNGVEIENKKATANVSISRYFDKSLSPYKVIATTANPGDTTTYSLSITSGNYSMYRRAPDSLKKPFIICDFMGAQFSQYSEFEKDFETVNKYKECGFNTLGIGIQFYNKDWPSQNIDTMERAFKYRGDIVDSLGLYIFAYDARKYGSFSADYPSSNTSEKLNLYKNLEKKYRNNLLGYFLMDEPHPRYFHNEGPYIYKKSHYFRHDDRKLVYVNLHPFNHHTVHKDTALYYYKDSLPDSIISSIDTTFKIDTLETDTGNIYDTTGIDTIDTSFTSDSAFIANKLFPEFKNKFFHEYPVSKTWELYKEYVHSYFYASGANVVSFDMYPLEKNGYVNFKGVYYYFKTLQLFASAAKETGKDFWIINNAFQRNSKGHPTKERMRYETNTALLYGIKGLTWFSYELGKTNEGKQDYDDDYTDWAVRNDIIYNDLKQVNFESSAIGDLRLSLEWDKVIHGSKYDPETFAKDKDNVPLDTVFMENGQPVTLQGSDAAYFALGRYTDHNKVPYYFVMNKYHNNPNSLSVTIPVFNKKVYYYDLVARTFKPLEEHGSYYNNGTSITLSIKPSELVVLKIGDSFNIAPIFNTLFNE